MFPSFKKSNFERKERINSHETKRAHSDNINLTSSVDTRNSNLHGDINIDHDSMQKITGGFNVSESLEEELFKSDSKNTGKSK